MTSKTETTADSKKLVFAFMFAMTLGLAPFVPEPHIWGKIKWVMGGAVGMQPMDWFDLVLHGTPWVNLIIQLVLYIKRRF
tara:strand:- start:270 stop:509 length:240 start_codon:yes stop_codon:yes gene_type:complete